MIAGRPVSKVPAMAIREEESDNGSHEGELDECR